MFYSETKRLIIGYFSFDIQIILKCCEDSTTLLLQLQYVTINIVPDREQKTPPSNL